MKLETQYIYRKIINCHEDEAVAVREFLMDHGYSIVQDIQKKKKQGGRFKTRRIVIGENRAGGSQEVRIENVEDICN